MQFPKQYICYDNETGSLDNPVRTPYFRRKFTLDCLPDSAIIRITGLGFYRLFINGQEITKGYLAPYITAPDRLVYFDDYEVSKLLTVGENCIGVWLGNGIWNNPGGYPWEIEKAHWRAAPQFAMRFESFGAENFAFETDEQFLAAPSPIVFDDFRFGERYDARLEEDGWSCADFCDLAWRPAIFAKEPTGENVMCPVKPIVTEEIITPVSIKKLKDSYLYDFGKNGAGVCEIRINGFAGQCVELQYGELLEESGDVQLKHQWFDDRKGFNRDAYICRGKGEETHKALFTYHGFRYVQVYGITEEQATKALLTYHFMHSQVDILAGFSCSDETVNALYNMTRRSDLSNLYYFPTDCPHREKHGWTGDAAFSSEHMLQNLSVDEYYHEWLHQMRAAQRPDGLIPMIVPTAGWGYHSSVGFDYALIEIPWRLWQYRGDKKAIEDNADAMWSLMTYFVNHSTQDGFDDYGIGDWSPVNAKQWIYISPVAFTNTLIAKYACEKAAQMFRVIGQKRRASYAEMLAKWFKENLREKMVDFDTMTAEGSCETSQAMAIYYGPFEPDEIQRAVEQLVEIIHAAGDVIDTGILGFRIIFHTLTEYGFSELAYRMIIGPKSPCFGDWVRQGETTMREQVVPDKDGICSHNHHFWGDISGWFMRNLAGIRVNDSGEDVHHIDLKPQFINLLEYVDAWEISVDGKITVNWKRNESEILLTTEVPNGCHGRIVLPENYVFENLSGECELKSGSYKIIQNEG